jgi:hypothetical protein
MSLHGIKPRLPVPLDRAADAWVAELPSKLWSIRTMPNRSTGYKMFFLVYGSEATLPTYIEHDSSRFVAYVDADNESARQVTIDLLEEYHDLIASRSAICQQNLRCYHSRRVRGCSFKESDLVLHLIQNKDKMHKLSPPWEGPFVISKVLNNGSYYLVDLCDRFIGKGRKRKLLEPNEKPHPWNIKLL